MLSEGSPGRMALELAGSAVEHVTLLAERSGRLRRGGRTTGRWPPQPLVTTPAPPRGPADTAARWPQAVGCAGSRAGRGGPGKRCGWHCGHVMELEDEDSEEQAAPRAAAAEEPEARAPWAALEPRLGT